MADNSSQETDFEDIKRGAEISNTEIAIDKEGTSFLSGKSISAENTWSGNEVRARLERESARDPLTGVANEKGISIGLGRLINEVLRDKDPSESLLVLKTDIRYFKAYDDLFTWAVGDECLKELAVLIRGDKKHEGAVRSDAVVGRLGGDDFVVITRVKRQDFGWNYKHPLISRLLEVGKKLHWSRRALDKDAFDKIAKENPDRVNHALRLPELNKKFDWDDLGMMTTSMGGLILSREDLMRLTGNSTLNIEDQENLLKLWKTKVNPLLDNVTQKAKDIKTEHSRGLLADAQGNALESFVTES